MQRRSGLPNGRAVAGGLVMAIAALAAFWLATSGDEADTVRVVVADHDLRVGDVVTRDDLRMVSVHIDGKVSGLYGSTEAVVDRVMVAPIDAGEFMLASSTTEAVADRADSFEMTVSLGPDRVPGALISGERVDVFATWNSGVTELIAVDAVVIDISETEDGLVEGGDLRIRLQMSDVGQVEAVVHAHSSGEATLVRSPGGDELTVGREYRPGGSPQSPDDEGGAEG